MRGLAVKRDTSPVPLGAPKAVEVAMTAMTGPVLVITGSGEPMQVAQLWVAGGADFAQTESGVAPSQIKPSADPAPDEHGVYTAGVRLLPLVTYQVDPDFPEDASRAHIQGDIVVRVVVGVDGRAHDVHVVKGLGHGLDEAAVKAASQYRFKPAMLHGKPVPVYLNLGLSFQIF